MSSCCGGTSWVSTGLNSLNHIYIIHIYIYIFIYIQWGSLYIYIYIYIWEEESSLHSGIPPRWQVQKAESFGINGRIGSFGYGEAVETTTMTTAFHVTKLAKRVCQNGTATGGRPSMLYYLGWGALVSIYFNIFQFELSPLPRMPVTTRDVFCF